MVEFVEFRLLDGGRVVVAADPGEQGRPDVVTRGGGVEQRLQEASVSFEEALDPIRAVGQGVLNRLACLEHPPTEVRVEFGLEISAKAGAIVSAAGTATLKVSLTWREPPNSPAGGAGGAVGP